MISEKPEYLEN